jgi:hypothetical protein
MWLARNISTAISEIVRIAQSMAQGDQTVKGEICQTDANHGEKITSYAVLYQGISP